MPTPQPKSMAAASHDFGQNSAIAACTVQRTECCTMHCGMTFTKWCTMCNVWCAMHCNMHCNMHCTMHCTMHSDMNHVLCCTALHCDALCCTVLHYAALRCTVLFDRRLHDATAVLREAVVDLVVPPLPHRVPVLHLVRGRVGVRVGVRVRVRVGVSVSQYSTDVTPGMPRASICATGVAGRDGGRRCCCGGRGGAVLGRDDSRAAAGAVRAAPPKLQPWCRAGVPRYACGTHGASGSGARAVDEP